MELRYFIKSEKGYWLPRGEGYTKDVDKAGRFTLEEMIGFGFNLDGCTLTRVMEWMM